MGKFWLLLGCIFITACGGGGGGDGPSGNANLANLVVTPAMLVPDFSSRVFSYTSEVANSVASVTVTPTTENGGATVMVNGVAVSSGSASGPIALAVGDTSIAVLVTAENGTRQTYTVVVTRRPPPSTNADLARLALTVAPLDQIFDSSVTAYTASAGNFGASSRVIAAPDDPLATMTLGGDTLVADLPSAAKALAVGANTATVEVTAEDGITTQAYVVDVSRDDLGAVMQEAYVKASNPGEDNFAASLSMAGNTLASGAPREASAAIGIDGNQVDNSLPDAGAAFLFDRAGTLWSQSAYVKASNTNANDRFGVAVALAGNTLAVAATGEQSRATGVNGDQSDNSGVSVGAVYVFDRDGAGLWQQAAYLKASNADDGDQFGGAVDLQADQLLVSAPLEASNAAGLNGDEADDSLADAGAAYLFDRDAAGDWAQSLYLKASNPDSGDQFGFAVAIGGVTAVVGAWGEDSAATGINGDQSSTAQVDSGAAYVFEIDNAGVWLQSAYVKASNTEADDFFGVALDIDGDVLAIGATGEDSAASGVNGNQSDNSAVDAGAVYVFERNGSGQWSLAAYVKASNPGTGDLFGSAVQVLGNLLVVGAVGERSAATGINGNQNDENAPDAGAVYVFERASTGGWAQIAYVKASNTNEGDRFGAALAIAGDSLVVGAPEEQSASPGVNGNELDNSLNSAGAVYVIR